MMNCHGSDALCTQSADCADTRISKTAIPSMSLRLLEASSFAVFLADTLKEVSVFHSLSAEVPVHPNSCVPLPKTHDISYK